MNMEGRVKFVSSDRSYGYIDAGQRGQGDFSFGPVADGIVVGSTVLFTPPSTGKRATGVSLVERNGVAICTEDKLAWCKEGADLEIKFVRHIAPLLGRELIIHPEKATNPYYMDLLDTRTGLPADLKCQNTPFFTVGKKYPGFTPTYTVTFNHKDYENYRINYPKSDIYWWVCWNQLKYDRQPEIQVEPLRGVWVSPVPLLDALIRSGGAPLHPYQHRKDDQINAKDSYVLDLCNSKTFTRLL